MKSPAFRSSVTGISTDSHQQGSRIARPGYRLDHKPMSSSDFSRTLVGRGRLLSLRAVGDFLDCSSLFLHAVLEFRVIMPRRQVGPARQPSSWLSFWRGCGSEPRPVT